MPQMLLNGDGPAGPTRFRLTRWREAYAIADVDALMSKIDDGTATSCDVANARFTPVRLRPGYEMGEVDEYLAQVEADLQASGR